MKIYPSLIFLSVSQFLSSGFAFGTETQPSPTVTPAGAPPETIVIEEVVGTAGQFGQQSVDFTWLFLKTIIAMVVVIALAVVVLRFVVPRLSLRRTKGQQRSISVVDRIPLDAKKGLYILEVEGRRLLIAASEHYVGLIAELDREDEKNTS